MIVIVCGGRNFTDYECVKKELNDLHEACQITLLVHGDARGADRLGKQWANENNIPTKAYPADWNTYGKKAGAIRNQQMLFDSSANFVIAFPGGRGTADMTRRAERKGTYVIYVK